MKKEVLIKQFRYKDLTFDTHPEVYDPAEDTYLLLDSIDVSENMYVLEIGTGCGIISLYFASQGANIICSDINPYAIELVKKNYLQNMNNLKGSIQIRQGDLFSVVDSKELFDIIIFNPPYLPTKKEDLTGGLGWFDKAVSGGIDGLQQTKRYIKELGNYLKPKGCAYFIYSNLSDKGKLEGFIKKNKLVFSIVNSKKFLDERLDVYKIKK